MDLTQQHPRPGETILGGYAWLARAIDKARAYNAGTLGDYIYPCPVDKELLSELNLTGEEFAEIVDHSADDKEVLNKIGADPDCPDADTIRWTMEFMSNRRDSLMLIAEDEGRSFVLPPWVEDVRPFAM